MSVKIPFPIQCKAEGWPEPIPEFKFHPERRWRFDWAWPDLRLAVERDGGGFIGGRHSRGGGMAADCEKYAAALGLGWRVLRVTPKQIDSGDAIRWLFDVMQWKTVAREPDAV